MNDTPSSPQDPQDPSFQDYRQQPPPPPSYAPPAPGTSPYGAPQQAGQHGHHTAVIPTARPTRSGTRRRTGLAAMALAAVLLVGGGAGLGGAAAYDAFNDDASPSGTTATSGQGTASPVVVGGDDDEAADGSVEQVAQTVLPSVVKLDVSGAQESGSGSGIILSSDGLVLTNDHVAAVAGEGGKITVSFNDGTRAPARIVGTDPLTDTALVQAEGVSGLTPATIGDSSGVDVGEQVVAIGSPFGLSATVTSGIVSALDRPVDVGSDQQGNATVYPAIQTDAAINPGNSGGPLVDLQGRVIGINSSIQSTSGGSGGEAGSIGLGFAIPINEVLPVIEQMKNGETPTHARIGVSVQDVAAQSGAEVVDGAQISQVGDDSAAGQAGLRDGDVITKVDDRQITGSDSLIATIRSYRPGDEVTITYERGGQEKTVELTLDSDAGATS
ncbi:S1C family serine protease [Nocardioides litoris]|uniref:S1C family serine protease n=1 Tax=Nocardioides litoris TaxID=1926648 RepID=UPI00111D4BA8|nr:trypsin-like peptidase domain-containing protein [Nocardioides litoris]